MANIACVIPVLLVLAAAMATASNTAALARHHAGRRHGGWLAAPPPPSPAPANSCRVPPVRTPCNCSSHQQQIAPGEGGAVSSPAEGPHPHESCVTVLRRLSSCVGFVTGTQPDTPTPTDICCLGLAEFFTSSSADGDRDLQCACPILTGEINAFLTRPVDSHRLAVLPVACAVAVPMRVFPICFAGQPTPPFVRNILESWENQSSSGAALSP